MKAPGLPLLAFALAGSSLAAENPVPAPPVKTSARLALEIRAALPKYEPPPAPPRNFSGPDVPETDPNVLALPKVTVKEYRPRDHDPDVWLTDRAVREKAMAAYKQSLTDFEWALNGWYIPLFGSSPSARARSAYKISKSMQELQRVHRLFTLISATDPKGAAELEQERVKMEQTEYWQARPAGHGRAK